MSKETEVVIYAKIGNMEGLKEAHDIEEQTQYESELKGKTRCRVRATTIKGKTTYTFTYKLKKEDDKELQERIEHNAVIDEEFFNDFKSVSIVALYKTRYIFNSKNVKLTLEKEGQTSFVTIPNIIYEVDVYKKPDDTISQWCKIDVEVDSIINFIEKNYPDLNGIKLNIKVSHLPFMPKETILAHKQHKLMDVVIDDIWKTEFNHDLTKKA
jgi:hypothetical protein